MRIWLKPDRMSAMNISPNDVRQALAANNSLSAIGSTKGNMIRVNLTANTDLTTTEEFENLVVREQDGSLIRLKDIADVVLGSESYDDEVRFSGNKATFMGIFVLPNANSVDVVKKIREMLPDIQKQLPAGMQVKIPYDSTEYINDSIHEVIKTLVACGNGTCRCDPSFPHRCMCHDGCLRIYN
jgi:multidrug efflux pump